MKQLRELPARFAALSAGVRAALIAGLGLAVLVAVGVGVMNKGGSDYQYVFTNLSQEDSTEATALLRNAGITAHVEANGSALSVPADKVYDARILLATSGIPKSSGVGFELFDRSDLGVSEFTQKIHLRRAIEGELARTIGNLSGVRSARVTVSLGEKGLYRDEDKKPSSSVVVVLQPGRTLGERELAGIRHLVSSAVSGLSPDQVTVLDGRGAVLSAESAWDSPEASYQRKLEHDLETRIVGLLEPVVGQGAVIARVTATVDSSQVSQNSEAFDPDSVVLKSERKQQANSSNQQNSNAGVSGAQANMPLQQPTPANGAPTTQGSSSSQDEVKNYEISKTVTTSVVKVPRLTKLSVAVVIDGVDGKARQAGDVARMGELARKAVGFDEARGDQFDITSQVFGRSTDVPDAKSEAAAAAAALAAAKTPVWVYAAIGAALLAVLVVGGVLLGRRRAPTATPDLVLSPGQTVSALEAKDRNDRGIDGFASPQRELPKGAENAASKPALIEPLGDLRERARQLVRSQPDRAAMLIRSWLSQDLDPKHEQVERG